MKVWGDNPDVTNGDKIWVLVLCGVSWVTFIISWVCLVCLAAVTGLISDAPLTMIGYWMTDLL